VNVGRNTDLSAPHVTGVRNALTDYGPTLLVPAAWTVTLAAQASLVARRTVLIALVVMTVLLAAFAVGARREMTGPVLGLWHRVIVVGFVVTVAGTVDLLVLSGDPLLPVTVAAWMAAPGGAYLLTARAVDKPAYRRVYLAGGACSLVGAFAYVVGVAGGALGGGVLAGTSGPGTAMAAGIVLVGLGQTAGIVAAAVQNRQIPT
jgi:hypothetical protein